MLKAVTLNSLGDGLAGDLFDREFDRVLENIADDATQADAKREINLKFTIKPNGTRTSAAIGVTASAKLANASGESATCYLVKDEKGIKASTVNPKQINFLKELEEKAK